MSISNSIPYTFIDFKPGQAPQPISAAQLNANFASVLSLSSSITIEITGDLLLTTIQANNTGFVFEGALTGQATITWPVFYGFATIFNATTGGFSLICGLSGGQFVTVTPGQLLLIFSDDTNFYASTTSTAQTATGTTTLGPSTYGTIFVNNTSAAAITITLPASPVFGQTIDGKDVAGNAAAYPITWKGAGSSTIDGAATYIFAGNYLAASFRWNGTGWSIL